MIAEMLPKTRDALGPERLADLARRADILSHHPEFDPVWYAETFPDVGLSDLSPQQHYASFGLWLDRPCGPGAAKAPDALRTAMLRQPLISFCISIMNRPDDIRGTLAENLENNMAFSDRIEFVLIFFDRDHETHQWVTERFPEHLASGYLRMIVEPPLDGWHFGKAKNRHRDYATGRVFSSLDGDNFLTPAEVRELEDIHAKHGDRFIFHHFSGKWGDGSSGRLSAPVGIFRETGYDERFMPRQYDEIDFILSAMAADPELTLVRVEGENHALASKRVSDFIARAGLDNPVVVRAPVDHRSPLNPKLESYVSDDPSISKMQMFNQYFSYMKNSPSDALRDSYYEKLIVARHEVVDVLAPEKIPATFFCAGEMPEPGSLPVGPEDVCLFACMKNDDQFLERFYGHYKKIGVRRFFVIDDGSDVPIRDLLPHPDVHVFRPKVGDFRTSKGMWMDGLIKAYLPEGAWALTVDADEFIDLPDGYENLGEVVRRLAGQGRDYMPGLLLDLVPGPHVTAEELSRSEERFEAVFDHCVQVETPVGADYAENHSVRWAFGEFAALSWRFDTRYHAFGTLDTLRKIPLLRHRAGRHLNQGFHTLHYTDGAPLRDRRCGTPRRCWFSGITSC